MTHRPFFGFFSTARHVVVMRDGFLSMCYVVLSVRAHRALCHIRSAVHACVRTCASLSIFFYLSIYFGNGLINGTLVREAW